MARVIYDEGGTSSNAASEETLEKLVKAMTAMGGPAAGAATVGLAGKTKKAEEKAIKNQTKSTKASTKATDDDTKATKDHSKATKTWTKAILQAGAAAAGSLVGSIAGAVTGVASELMAGGTQMSGYTKHLAENVPIFKEFAGGVQALIGGFEHHMNTFRDMASIGATTGNNLMQFTHQAAKAGISVETLTGIVKENAAGFAQATGSVAGGVDAYTTFHANLRKTHGDTYDRMGMRVEEQAEISAEFFALEMKRTRGKVRLDGTLTKSANSYMMELDKLTKLTGMTRKEAANELAKQQEDKIMKGWMRAADSGSAAYVGRLNTMFDKADPVMASIFKELVASGTLVTDEAKEAAAAVPEFTKFAEYVHEHTKNGKAMTKEQKATADKMLQKATEAADNDIKRTGAFGTTLAQMGVNVYAVRDALASFNSKIGEATKTIADEQTGQAGGDTSLTAQTVLMETALAMQVAVADKIMPEVQKAFNSVTDYLKTNGKDKIKEAVDKLEKMIKKASGLIGKGMPDAKKIIQKGWDKATETISNIANTIETGYDNLGQSNLYKEANKRLLEINKEQKEINAKITTGTLTEEQLEKAKERLAVLKKEAMEVNAVLTAEKKDVSTLDKLSAFFDDIDWGAVGLGLAAVGAALLVIKGAIALGALAIAGLGALSGFMLIGAAVIAGIAAAVWLVSDSIGGIADGLKRMSEVKIDDNMKKMPGFLGDLAGPLTALAGGGIVAQLGGGGLKKLADGVKEFQDIRVDNLAKTGPALTALYEGISKFTGDSLLDKAGKFLGGLFGGSGSTSGMKEIAEGLQDFKDVDASGLEKIGKGLEGITGFVEAMKNADIDRTSDKIEKLIKNLKEYQKQTANMPGDLSANLSTTMKAVMSDSGASVDKLNSSMQTLIELVQAGNKIETKQLQALEER